ncbi:MAG: phage tail protein [Lachnospiraceae bacterium]|jgi:phage-related tail fiber protein|nr:phage tail protein [Lachnospiraceae bacterium]
MAGVFNEAVLTEKGIALLAKAQAGLTTITLTKAASGDGSYTEGEDISKQTALKSQKQEFSINTVMVQNVSNVFVKFIITNYKSETEYLTHGYYVKEIGLFATDPDEGEILYAIATAVTDQWDYLPAYNDLLPSTITIEMLTEVANADTVTIEAPNKMYLYDDTTGDKYVLGVENGLLYYEEVEE